MKNCALFWFRRDLRLQDNHGLYQALKENEAVVPIFIFDSKILDKLQNKTDRRVQFIHQTLAEMKGELQKLHSDLLVLYGTPLDVFQKLQNTFKIKAIYTNHDYEPEAKKRDEQVQAWAKSSGIEFKSFKDQCIFEKLEILTRADQPYSVFTPYKTRWLEQLKPEMVQPFATQSLKQNYAKLSRSPLISLKEVGFNPIDFIYPDKVVSDTCLRQYAKQRDWPGLEHGTSRLGIHLRFGTISIRQLVRQTMDLSSIWLSELIWREFFMQILWNFPFVVTRSFREQYDQIQWRNDSKDFRRWCEGKTGYPFVDAGMRELNETGHMHNRLRMVTASFLTKHLLIHWSKGERYFAERLLDYDLAANNGNWQWAAGTGCDAAPYFRVFNPETQAKKFDPDEVYIKKWVPEFKSPQYVKPMVEHKVARIRCLNAFQNVLKNKI